MKRNKGRVFWIDNIRCMMAALIICFHYAATPESFVSFVYPFTLPFFFVISGYFFRNRGGSFSQFLGNKMRTYFPMIVLNASIVCVLEGMTGESIIRMLKKLILQVYGCESLWFLACMMISQIIMYFIVRFCKGDANRVLVFCAGFFVAGTIWTQCTEIRLVWSADIALMQMIFMGMGYWYYNNEEKVENLISKSVLLYIIIYCGLALAFPNNDIHRRLYSCIWVYPIQALLGILILTEVFKRWANRPIPVMTYLGRNSLYIYAFHGYALSLYNRLIGNAFSIEQNGASVPLTIGAVLFSFMLVYCGCVIWLKIKLVFIESGKMETHNTREKNMQIEGIRAIALLIILSYHYTFRFHEIYEGEVIGWLSEFGVYGVSIFFALSGYFATRINIQRSSSRDIVIRSLSKLIKLWIPYVVSITITFTMTRWIDLPGRSVGFKAYLLNIPFLNGFIGIPYVDAAHWYMTQMVAFIVVMMFLQIFCLHNKKATYGIWLTVSLICLVLQQFSFSGHTSQLLSFVQLLTGGKYAGAYIEGILLQFLMKDQHPKQRCYSLVLLAYAGTLFACTYGLCAGIILMAAAAGIEMAAQGKLVFLQWKPLVFLGAISYGVYLIHQNVGYMIRLHYPGLAGYCMAFFAALILGTVLTKLKQKSDIHVTRIAEYIRHC